MSINTSLQACGGNNGSGRVRVVGVPDILCFHFSLFSGVTGTYPLISPNWAPFLCSGRLFDTNSTKTSTIVWGIPQFSARSVIGDYIEARNNS